MADSKVPKFEDTEPIFEETTPIEEVSTTIPSQEFTQAESALKGVQQGTTLGFGNELQGGIEAGADTVHSLLNKLGLAGPSVSEVNAETGAPGPQSTLDLYRQARDKSRQEFEAAQAANPGSYTAGVVGGGLLSAMATPQALMNPLGSAPKTAPLLQKVAQGAFNAVPAAATMSAGEATADLTQGQLGDFGSQVAQGTAIGAAAGGAMPLIGATVGGVKNAATQSKVMQDLLDSYRTGLEGLNLSSPKFLKESRDTLKKIAGEVEDKIKETTQKLFGEKQNVLQDLERRGVVVDTSEPINKLANMQSASPLLKPHESGAIMNTVKDIMSKGNIKGPLEIENTLSKLKDLKGSAETTAGHQMIDEAIASLRNIQNNMDPQIQQINKQLNHVIDASDAIMNKGVLEYGAGAEDLVNREKMASLFETGNKYKTESFLDDILNKGLQTTKNAEIQPLSQSVPEAAKLIESTTPIARKMELAKDIQKPTFRGSNLIDSTLNAVKTSGSNIANKAGMGVKQNQEFLQKGVKFLSDLSPENTQFLATKMSALGKQGEAYAKVISETANKNSISKNAIMFGLMQQPEFRDMLRKTTNEDLGNGETGR